MALSLLFANLGLVLENCPHILSVGRSLSFVFWGREEYLDPFGLHLLAFLLEAEFVRSRFEPALLGVTLVFATPKTFFLLGAAPLKRLFHCFQSLYSVMALLYPFNYILTKEDIRLFKLFITHVSYIFMDPQQGLSLSLFSQAGKHIAH